MFYFFCTSIQRKEQHIVLFIRFLSTPNVVKYLSSCYDVAALSLFSPKVIKGIKQNTAYRVGEKRKEALTAKRIQKLSQNLLRNHSFTWRLLPLMSNRQRKRLQINNYTFLLSVVSIEMYMAALMLELP